MSDGVTEALHTLLHVFHLTLDAVLILQQILQLEVLEDLEDDLALLLG